MKIEKESKLKVIDVAKHIEITESNIENENVIFNDELLKHFVGDLVNDSNFRLCLESDPTSALVFIMYIETHKSDDIHKAEELIELKGFITQFISHAYFLNKPHSSKNGNIIENLIIGFKEIYFELREPRVYFLNKILILIDKELHKIYSKETQIIVEKNTLSFDTKRVWGLYIALQKKVRILPNNNTQIAKHIAPLIGIIPTQLSKSITTDKCYNEHDVNFEDLETIEYALKAMLKEVDKLKISKK